MMSTISIFKKIYPNHVMIPIQLPQKNVGDGELSLNRVDLNQVCIEPVKQWIKKELNLDVKPTFPCWLHRSENFEFISKLVNGFALQVGNNRIVFIPSDVTDLEEFEVPQEWVDLPNWAGSYYVPIRVDLEHQFLHLWGFIAYEDIKEQVKLDRVFRNYYIAQEKTIDDLYLLQDGCELISPTSSQSQINSQFQLSPTEAKSLIQQLQQRKSRLSPRLDIPFTQWGAILDRPQSLGCYANTGTDLGNWIENAKLAICDGWESIDHFLNPPQAIPVLWEDANDTIKGISLDPDLDIKAKITKLYSQQTELSIPKDLIEIDTLIPLLKSCRIANVWWQAAAYLCTIQPDHPLLTTRIRQIETRFAGKSIALRISMIPTLDDHIAVFVMIYPIGKETFLPPGLQLTIQDDFNKNLLVDSQGNPDSITAGEEIKDSWIQLYFTVDSGDRFTTCIELDSVKVIETFKL
jgi:hypothetical protein